MIYADKDNSRDTNKTRQGINRFSAFLLGFQIVAVITGSGLNVGMTD